MTGALAESFGGKPDDVTVSEMMNYLRYQLTTAGSKLEGRPTALRRSCLSWQCWRWLPDRQIELQQDQMFGPMWIRVNTLEDGYLVAIGYRLLDSYPRAIRYRIVSMSYPVAIGYPFLI